MTNMWSLSLVAIDILMSTSRIKGPQKFEDFARQKYI